MCGILMASTKGARIDYELVAEMLKANSQRGGQGYGILSPQGVLHQGPGLPRLADFQVSSFFYHGFMAHVRIPTGQMGKGLFAHPVQWGDHYLAHNGILVPPVDGFDRRMFTQDHPGDIDTSNLMVDIMWRLTHMVSPTEVALKYAINATEGQMACWFHKTGEGTYLWRQMSPLYTNWSKNVLYVSSVPLDDGWTSLLEGTIYKLDGDEIHEVETFNPKSIYGDLSR